MKPAPRQWEVAPTAQLDGHPPLLGQVLSARGHTAQSAALFLESSSAYLRPSLLLGMDQAVTTLRETMAAGEKIAIYGDYDTDGVTACSLLIRALRRGGADVIPHIPNRMRDGYGLHLAALQDLHAAGVSCVITVDCGTGSVDAAANRPTGMKLIITDHHLPPSGDGDTVTLAPADALVNPKQPGCTYPFEGLAGAGVAFKLVQAMEEAGGLPPGTSDSVVGLAALGTVADMMPLHGENRRIVADGMLHLPEICGISALCDLAQLARPLRSSDLGFALAPRINAAGRMEDAELALRLCLSDDPDEALALAAQLNEQNKRRQEAVATALAAAELAVSELDDDLPAIVLGHPGWPMGIVGLVAGRLAERYARPTFVVCLDPVEGKGSARSAPGVHLVEALDGAAHTLIRYGGHAAAAGFSLEVERFDDFRAAVLEAVAQQLGDRQPHRRFAIDGELTCAGLRPDACRELASLEPCGMGNVEPLFLIRDVQVLSTSTFGAEKQHLRLTVGDGSGIAEAIAFFKGATASHLPRGRRLDLCCSMDLDSWQGQERVRLRLRDIRPAQVVSAELVSAG